MGPHTEGFAAEWRVIDLLTVEGDLISRCEFFDEADLDAALARFDELDRPAPLLENTATRTWARLADAFNRRDMAGLVALSSADGRYEDRRKGLREELEGPARQKAAHSALQTVPSGWRMEVEPIAIRGAHLSLTREYYRDTDDADQPIAVELLRVTQVGDDSLTHDTVILDPDDINAAFAELDNRYLAGEAADHAHTWSLVKHRYAALNRHELPSDRININDHRRIGMVEPGDPTALLRAGWDLTPDFSVHIEAVHRLGALGAVVTRVTNATSEEGFAAEWRAIDLWAVEGDLVTRCELFDEADLDAALVRFDELSVKSQPK